MMRIVWLTFLFHLEFRVFITTTFLVHEKPWKPFSCYEYLVEALREGNSRLFFFVSVLTLIPTVQYIHVLPVHHPNMEWLVVHGLHIDRGPYPPMKRRPILRSKFIYIDLTRFHHVHDTSQITCVSIMIGMSHASVSGTKREINDARAITVQCQYFRICKSSWYEHRPKTTSKGWTSAYYSIAVMQ